MQSITASRERSLGIAPADTENVPPVPSQFRDGTACRARAGPRPFLPRGVQPPPGPRDTRDGPSACPHQSFQPGPPALPARLQPRLHPVELDSGRGCAEGPRGGPGLESLSVPQPSHASENLEPSQGGRKWQRSAVRGTRAVISSEVWAGWWSAPEDARQARSLHASRRNDLGSSHQLLPLAIGSRGVSSAASRGLPSASSGCSVCRGYPARFCSSADLPGAAVCAAMMPRVLI